MEALLNILNELHPEVDFETATGLIDNKISCLGRSVAEVAREVVATMVTDESELITVFSGADVKTEDAEELHAFLEETYDMCDVSLHEGGQPLYDFLISAE